MKMWKISLLAVLAATTLFFGADVIAADIPLFPEQNSGQTNFLPPPDTPINTDQNDGRTIIAGAIMAVIDVLKYLLGIVAIAFVVFGGMRLVAAGGSDDQVEKGKRGVTWGIVGLVFALMVDNVIFDVIYGNGARIDDGEFTTEEINDLIVDGTTLILDALNWAQAIIVIGAVGFVIFSGARMISALGNEDVISKQRTAFLWVGLGLIVILLNQVLVQEVLYPVLLAETAEEVAVQYTPDATKGIEEITSIIVYFLQFLAVIAFLAFVYGGIRMVTAFGDDEAVESGKKVLTGAVIGILIILMSYVIVSSLISGTVNG